jgi:hypothetical protein
MEDVFRFDELVNRYLDSGGSAKDVAELGRMIIANPAAAAEFVRKVQFDIVLEETLDEQKQSEWLDKFLLRAHQLELLSELSDVAETVPPIPVKAARSQPPHAKLGITSKSPRNKFRLNRIRLSVRKLSWLSALTLLGICVIATAVVLIQNANVPPEHTIAGDSSHPVDKAGIIKLPVATLALAADCIWEGEAVPPAQGDWLPADRKLKLKSGLAKIVFQNGAQAILEGPAVLELHSFSNVALARGKLTVTVEDPSARGFEVDSPGMRYTDFGTEFGVLVSATGEQEVHVFRGTVKAEERVASAETHGAGDNPHTSGGRGAEVSGGHGVPRSLILMANDAIRVTAPNAATGATAIKRIAADEKQFVRTLLEPFSIFGTGVGLNSGVEDPHWEIASATTEAGFKPRPAVVALPLPFYLPGDRNSGQWIANTEKLETLPGGCRMTFRTRFDLSKFDPTTARIEGKISADDWIMEMRVNGKPVPLPNGSHDGLLFEKWLDFKIENGFIDGQNTLEIVIENAVHQSTEGINAMALCVDCKGLALPRRAPKR